MADGREYFFPWKSRLLEDGAYSTSDDYILMRKRTETGWIYRRPTDDELREYASQEAW